MTAIKLLRHRHILVRLGRQCFFLHQVLWNGLMIGLAWIDFDQDDRDRTRRIIDLFDEKDTRDELGLGAIRDALADLMFPGTSTIQTRLRYMLLVPWIYRRVAREQSSRMPLERARAMEISLIRALEEGGETEGVIGSVAREGLKRVPSDVYWAGLFTLGIRRLPGSRQAYLEARDITPYWAPNLPEETGDFLTRTSFQLRSDEADFLRDQLRLSVPGSLYTELALARDDTDCEVIWDHPGRSNFSSENQAIVAQAEYFSALMHGASLLYNLMLAQRAHALRGEAAPSNDERAEEYRSRLNSWRQSVQKVDLPGWDLDNLWQFSLRTAHRIGPLTRQFVSDWKDIVLASDANVEENAVARRAIEKREHRLKGTKARLFNDAALARWGGASGAQALTFRWRETRTHLKDLANA